MKNRFMWLVMFVVLSQAVYAEVNQGMYVGIGMSNSNIKSGDAKYKANNLKLTVGGFVTKFVSFEGQYIDFSKSEILKVSGVNADLSADSIGFAMALHPSPEGDFSPFVKIGVHKWDANLSLGVASAFAGEDNIDGTDPFYAAGIDIPVNENLTFRMEVERLKFDSENMDNVGVSFIFH